MVASVSNCRPFDESAVDHEYAVLGCLLLAPERIAAVDLLSQEFSDTRLAEVFGTMLGLHREGIPPDLVAMVSHFKEKTGRNEWTAWLAEMAESTFSPANLDAYVAAIKKKARARRVKEFGERLISFPDSAEEVIHELVSFLQANAEENEQGVFKLFGVQDLLEQSAAPEYVIDGLLERETLAVMFGDSDTYKSFVAIDWAMSIATGRDWRGRSVAEGPVVYLKGEGHRGFGRRVEAWIRQNECGEDAPFYASAIGAELVLPESLAAVHAAIEATCKPPSLVVIDTLDANFGPGDEGKTADMKEFINAALSVVARYRCTVLVVHHVGHGDKGRERGAYHLRGRADTRILVERDDGGKHMTQLTFEKVKDGEKPPPLTLTLEPVILPYATEDGNPVTSLAITQVGEAEPSGAKRRGLTGNNRLAMSALHQALDATRRCPPSEVVNRSSIHDGQTAVTLDEWREAFYPTQGDKSQEAKQKAFRRAVTSLQPGHVRIFDEWAFLATEGTE